MVHTERAETAVSAREQRIALYKKRPTTRHGNGNGMEQRQTGGTYSEYRKQDHENINSH